MKRSITNQIINLSKFKLVQTSCFLLLIIIQSVVYGDIIGAVKVEELYHRVKSSLDRSTLSEPYYLETEKNKDIESGEAAYYLPLNLGEIATELSSVKNWCEVMSLHINVKTCTYDEENNAITVYMGRKFYQAPEEAFDLTYDFKTISNDGYFAAIAIAKNGPLGTSDYHIEVEIIPVDENKSFGRIYVSNKRSWISSVAMKLYLATKGKNKRGIRVVGQDAEGNPVYSGGESGVAERNLLRYYFAFIAFFSELEEKDQQKRHDGQLTFWFDQIEKYPQLYEMSREKYLDQKRKERLNQIALQGSQQ